MPNQIDRCATCAAPIYAEDNVPGACGCNDGMYRSLLAQAKQQNQTRRVTTASTQASLPPLPPDLFGPAGPREDPNTIQFSSMDVEFDVEFPEEQGHYVPPEQRTRIDRPRNLPAFNRQMMPGPQGGPMREVGRVRGFRVEAEIPVSREAGEEAYFDFSSAPPPPENPLRQQERRANPPQCVRTAAEKRFQAAITKTTVYDKLTKGYLDDD